METKYKVRCRECGHKDKLTVDSNGDMSCKNCGADLGVRASNNLDITIMMSWQDMQRLRKLKPLRKGKKDYES